MEDTVFRSKCKACSETMLIEISGMKCPGFRLNLSVLYNNILCKETFKVVQVNYLLMLLYTQSAMYKNLIMYLGTFIQTDA